MLSSAWLLSSVMGGYTTTTSSTTSTSGSSSCFPLQNHQEGHVSSSSSSSSLTVASHRAGQTQMPFSSYYSAQPSAAHVREERGEESGAGSGCPAVAVSGAEGYDCESEEGVEVLEEPVKPAPQRSSGSKRSRAAEVHNLSEKRRRSRINEKMKALQNLIPNSNKTDKASMLDEAIEYLKQLQLQVQMLSLRNGLNLHPMYFPGAMQPLQAPQISMGYGVNNEAVMNMNAGMLALNQETSALNSFGSPNPCTPSHQSILPNLTNISNPEPSFRIESSQPHSGSFQLTVPTEGIFSEDLVSQQQLDRGDITKSLQENKAKSMALTASMPFGGQESLLDADHLEICMLGKERSQDMLTKDPEHQIFVQDLHGLQVRRSFPCGDVKAESMEH